MGIGGALVGIGGAKQGNWWGIGYMLLYMDIAFLQENTYSVRALVGPAYPLYNIKEWND